MKRKLAGVLAALMVLTMGTTVSAAQSSTKESDLKKEAERLVTTVESGSDSVTLTASVVATADLEAVYSEVTEKIGSDTGFEVLAAVELASATTLPSGGVSIKFNVSGLTSGTKNIRIYHKMTSGWEIKTPYVGSGYVTATFTSLSPFFVVRYDSTPSVNDGSEDQSSVVNNYFYNNSNNTTTVNNTNSNNTTTTTNTNSNNTTTTTNTNSNNTTTSTNTDSNNTTTTNGKDQTNQNASDQNAADKNSTDKNTSDKDKNGKDKTGKDKSGKDKSDKNTSSDSSANADGTNTNRNDNSSNNSSKNTQTVTINVSTGSSSSSGTGSSSGSGSGSSSSAKGGTSTSTTSPKTGSSLPALPIIAVFLVMGIAVCGKKARNL